MYPHSLSPNNHPVPFLDFFIQTQVFFQSQSNGKVTGWYNFITVKINGN